MKIGVFDSGFGGLTIFKEIISELPQYDYIYLGDNARAPYGDRSDEIIYEFTCQGVDFLFRQNCQLIILACNTASALALRKIQQEWLPKHYPNRRVLGIIIPLTESMVKLTKKSRVGLIATRATVESQAFDRELVKRQKKETNLFSKACPLLVPIIEEGWHKTVPAKMILKKYLRPVKQKNIDTLVLGCTHYPILIKDIARIMGKNVKIINPGKIIARSIADYLIRHPELEKQLAKKSSLRFFTTDKSTRMNNLAMLFWGSAIKLEKCHIDSLSKN